MARTKRNVNGHAAAGQGFLKLMAAMVAVTTCMSAHAASLTHDVSLPLLAEYDSNPFLSSSDEEESIWRYTARPGYKLNITNDRDLWFLDASVLVQRSSNRNILDDREDPKVVVGWKRDFERSTFDIDAAYEESATRLVELTGSGIVGNDITQRGRSIGANWLGSLSERLTLGINADYLEVDYDQNDSGFADYTNAVVGSILTYSVNERMDTTLEVSHSRLRSDLDDDIPGASGDTNLTGVLIGMNYKLSDRLSWFIKGGANKVSGDVSDTNWQGSLGTVYTAERILASAQLKRAQVASGIGGFIESDDLAILYSYALSDLSRVGFDFNWYKVQSSSIQDLDYELRQLGGFYERQLSNEWQARVTAVKKDAEFNQNDADANIIGFSIIYSGQFF
jgi:hypothetical protein